MLVLEAGDRGGLVEVGYRSECVGWVNGQSADCPEAEARHGQTGCR